MIFSSGLTKTSVAPNTTAVTGLEDRLSEAAHQLHGAAASIADSKARYEATHDARFLESIKAVLPLYGYWLRQYQDTAKQLGGRETPAQFLATLDTTSDWLIRQTQNVVEGVTGVIAAAPKVATQLPTLLMVALIVGGIVAVAYVAGQVGPLVKAAKATV